MKNYNEATKYIISHYEMHANDEEAAIIEDIMKMNNGSDKDIIIENLRGWFTAKAPTDTLVDRIYSDMLVEVNWENVYTELHQDVYGRKVAA